VRAKVLKMLWRKILIEFQGGEGSTDELFHKFALGTMQIAK